MKRRHLRELMRQRAIERRQAAAFLAEAIRQRRNPFTLDAPVTACEHGFYVRCPFCNRTTEEIPF